MKIVIDIDKKKYEEIKRIAKAQFELTDKTEAQIIANGTPLPKGHGDLIDRSKLQPKLHGTKSIIAGLEAPTVIPADNSEVN